MRHRRAGVHLSRPAAHRKALFSNLVAALLTNERIQTTDAKAKETRRLTERTITWARRVGDILVKKPDRRTTEESARVVHAIRMARRIVRDRSAVTKLFDDIAPRFMDRRGGYTRILKIGQRPGDAASMSLLELVGNEGGNGKKETAPDDKATKGAPTAKADKGDKKVAAKAEASAAKAKKTSAAKAEGASKPAAKKKAKAEE
jgi:large subunit ribosomal protein L17